MNSDIRLRAWRETRRGEIDTCHNVMMSLPKRLAALLLDRSSVS